MVSNGASGFTLSNGVRVEIPNPNPPAIPVFHIIGSGVTQNSGFFADASGPVVQLR